MNNSFSFRRPLFAAAALIGAAAVAGGCDSSKPDDADAPQLYEQLWSVPTDFQQWAKSRPGVSDGRTYAQVDDSLTAFDIITGERLWSVWLSDYNMVARHIITDARNVYFNTAGWVFAYEAATGALAWRQRLPSDYGSGPAGLLFQDDARLYLSGHDQLVSLYKADGALAYVLPLRIAEPATLQIFFQGARADDGLLYLPSEYLPGAKDPAIPNGENSGTLYCVDGPTAEIRWTYEPPTYDIYNPFTDSIEQRRAGFDGATVSGDYVLVTGGPFLIALDRFTGQERWRAGEVSEGPGGFGGTKKPLAADDRHVYAGTIDGYVIAYDLHTGEEVWRHRVYTSVTGFAPLVYGERVFFVHDFGNGLFVYDRNTGKVLLDGANPPDSQRLWDEEGIYAVYWTPPVIADETLVVGGTTGVYALHVGPPD